MIKMRAIGAALLGSALLGVLLPAAPAQAACTTTINSVTVPEVIIYATTASRVKATVSVSDGCDSAPYVSGDAFLRDGESWGMYESSSSGSKHYLASGAYIDKYSAHGKGSVNIEAWGSTNAYRDGTPLYVRRNVEIATHNASPEPVRKGSLIKVAGTVRRLTVNSYGDAKYVPYASHLMSYWFRAAGTSSYVQKGTGYTNSSGAFAKSFTASVDGYWYARSTQTSYYRGRNGTPDFVDVVS